MKETESQLAISCHQMGLPVPELGSIQLAVHQGKSYGNPSTAQTTIKTMDCCLKTDSQTPLLRTTSTEHGEDELVPTQSLHPYVLVSLE